MGIGTHAALSSETQATLKNATGIKSYVPIAYSLSASEAAWFCPNSDDCPNMIVESDDAFSDFFGDDGSQSEAIDLDPSPTVGLIAASSSALPSPFGSLLND